ncbi:MAG TPA: cell envelope integrity protein CreD, partial [Rhodocyclaceae bacterium]|nr:cell envelope integrity protein CreD [Rhodocyclaceae bacterium]
QGQPSKSRKRLLEQTQQIPASQLTTLGKAHVETRQRGIYRGQIYHVGMTLEGEVETPQKLETANGRPMLNPRAFLIMSVSDLRGVDNAPVITINGSPRKLQSGNLKFCPVSCIAGEKMYVDLGEIDPTAPRKIKFSLPLSLTGTQSLAIAPVAESNTVELKSDWPHPSFTGRFLPRQHEVSKQGFFGSWQVSNLSRNFEKTLQGDGEFVQVTLMDPVNIYLLAIRAVKYGILFVLLTFGGFFITEVLRRSPIHPIQYLLVGLALAIFFLLLIALSEHVPFHLAYLIAATACIGLITFYLAGALGGWGPGVGFGAGLTGLYGVLYGILHSEDNALLIGSIFLFIALGSVMVGTRRLNWYRVGNEPQGEVA